MQTNSFMTYKIPCRKDIGRIRGRVRTELRTDRSFRRQIGRGSGHQYSAACHRSRRFLTPSAFWITDLPVTPEKSVHGYAEADVSGR